MTLSQGPNVFNFNAFFNSFYDRREALFLMSLNLLPNLKGLNNIHSY